MQLPNHLEPVYDSTQIEARVGELAASLNKWAVEAKAETGRLLLTVCLLRGGVFFFSDLLLHLSHSVEPGFCRAWSYAKGSNGHQEDTVRIDWQGLEVRDRHVVLIDNICDSGRTLATASAQLNSWGARKVRSTVIVHRQREDSHHTPTLTGFVYPGVEWLVGYGLRDQDAEMMNTRAIFSLRDRGTS